MALTFRPLSEEDLEWARDLHNDPDVLVMLTDAHIVSKEEQKLWYKSLITSKNKKRLVVFHDNIRIGVIRLDEIDDSNRSVRIGLDIHKDYRNQGFGTKTYYKLLDYCFFELKMHRVYLMVAEYNKVALHLYTKLGFKKEGVMRDALFRHDRFNDYIVMSILEDEYVKKTQA